MIRVFVGTDSDVHGDAEKVLEYSIRKNTVEDVDLTFMNPGWKSFPTGFTTHRYMIPQICNWGGYAIYLDVDMLVLGDLSELMSYKQTGKWAICDTGRHRDEVAVIDCSIVLPTEDELKSKEGKSLAKRALREHYSTTIPSTWNTEVLGEDAKLIHYTNMRTQPWQPDPMIDYMPHSCEKTYNLFFDYLKEANRLDEKKIFRVKNFKIAFADAPTTGYVVECGVGEGKSLKKLVQLANPNQLVFGFDSFKGLPEEWKMSDIFTWSVGSFACDIPDIEGAEIRVGYFADALPVWKKEHPGRIALLHIDSDLYSSAVTVLSELNDQIVPGTVIISDDHFYKSGIGETGHEYTNWQEGVYKAFNEWTEKYNRKTHLLSKGTLGQASFRVIQ